MIYELNTGRDNSILTFTRAATSRKAKYLVQGTQDEPKIVYAGLSDVDELPFSFPTDKELRDYSKSVSCIANLEDISSSFISLRFQIK